MMEQGNVHWYSFTRPDKRRPVVILTRNTIIPYLTEVTIAPITTTIRDIPSEVVLDESDGLKTRCAVNLDHVQTVSKSKIGPFISRLSEEKMLSIKRALLFALGFE